MRRLIAGLAFLSLSVAGLLPEAKAEVDPKYIEGLNKCFVSEDELVPHKKAYQAGKYAAEAINVWYLAGMDMKPDTGDETPQMKEVQRTIFLKSKASFASIGPLALTAMGEHYQAGCLAAQMTPLKEDPWSSVHSGLTDTLIPELKEHFFSVPDF